MKFTAIGPAKAGHYRITTELKPDATELRREARPPRRKRPARHESLPRCPAGPRAARFPFSWLRLRRAAVWPRPPVRPPREAEPPFPASAPRSAADRRRRLLRLRCGAGR